MSGSALNSTDCRADRPLGLRVVEAVAETEDVAVDEMDPMSEHVDLEAVEDLVASADDDLSVRWFVDGTLVEVDGTGAIRVS